MMLYQLHVKLKPLRKWNSVFKLLYRRKHYQQAAQIKQNYLNQCKGFLDIIDNMKIHNDLAISYKNAGNRVACRQVLQAIEPYLESNQNTGDSFATVEEAYQREVKHARFNQRACR